MHEVVAGEHDAEEEHNLHEVVAGEHDAEEGHNLHVVVEHNLNAVVVDHN